jgi:hypothetical protein
MARWVGCKLSPGQDVDRCPPVDRQSFTQDDNIYSLEKVQINKLNVYLQFKLNYDVFTYIYSKAIYVRIFGINVEDKILKKYWVSIAVILVSSICRNEM